MKAKKVGSPKLDTQKLVHGVGINDADYVTQKWETIEYVNGKQKKKLVWGVPLLQSLEEHATALLLY